MRSQATDASPRVAPWLLSIDEYHRLLDRHVLRKGAQVELVAGLLRERTAPSRAHKQFVTHLHRQLAQAIPAAYQLLSAAPLTVGDDTEVSPDLAVVHASEVAQALRCPTTASLVVDVAEERLELIRADVLARYARARVAEVWLVSLIDDLVSCCWKPETASGAYQHVLRLELGALLRSTALPGVTVNSSVIS